MTYLSASCKRTFASARGHGLRAVYCVLIPWRGRRGHGEKYFYIGRGERGGQVSALSSGFLSRMMANNFW